MDRIINFFKRDDVELYTTLVVIIGALFLLKPFLSLILFVVIFSFLGHVGTKNLRKILPLNQPIATVILYLLVIGLLVVVVSVAAPLLAEQFSGLPKLIEETIDKHPVFDAQVYDWLQKAIHNSSLLKHGSDLAVTGLIQLGHVGRGVEHVIMAIFLSFIFNLTYNHLQHFGHAFLHSRYKRIFINIYTLATKFVTILGTVIETQLIICTINTILMTIGLWIIGMPSLLVLSLLVFILGLIPVAGVLISLIPLSIIGFSVNGLITVAEVLILVVIIHAFESYFLHPRLMANATALPIFVTFITLIISDEIFGTWGLIVGIPIVAFFFDILGVSIRQKRPDNLKQSIHSELDD
ncbi:AI-2E family transporter [Pediococcus siamensis]|uniref:AI-2E family transporter n=1 Tax=Pediococcus siamensis TaxID=381829 RepID=UPI00399F7020